MDEASSYARAGVNITAADRLKAKMQSLIRRTHTDSVIGQPGGFGGVYSLSELAHSDILLVGSADGVGTKLKLAFASGKHDTVGQDLVNHLVNDILCCGARPLFFFDYLAYGRVGEEVALQIIDGLSRACRQNGLALLGGETAQMPGFYADGEYDLAGFIVGQVSRKNLIDGSTISDGDLIVGLASNGLHTNGYTLARTVLLDKAGLKMGDMIPETGSEIYSELMKIHRSYLPAIEPLLDRRLLKGIAHITGGGFEGNIARIIPDGLAAEIDIRSWNVPLIFRAIQNWGGITDEEMYRVFNMGIGIVLICDRKDVKVVMDSCKDADAVVIGSCKKGPRKVILKDGRQTA